MPGCQCTSVRVCLSRPTAAVRLLWGNFKGQTMIDLDRPDPLWYATRVKRTERGPLSQPVSVFHTKYIPGGGKVASVPLWYALLERHRTDAHFATYTTTEEVRATKTGGPYQIQFNCATYDLDYEGHKSRPNPADFGNFCRSLIVQDHVPNIAYPTRGGARIIFYVDQLTDPAEFEAHYQSLMGKLALDHTPFKLDRVAKDWTRLFRCPRVVRDGEKAYSVPVYEFHDRVLDLRRFEVKPIAKRIVKHDGTAKFTGCDPWLSTKLKQMAEGNRNSTIYAALRHVMEKYTPEAQEQWVAILEERALAEGMEEREFWRTYRSASESTTGK